jgi:hypothetical protein
MARVLALIPDLLFGSRVQSALTVAGHEVELLVDPARFADRLGGRLEERLREEPAREARVIVVDLTSTELDGPTLIGEMRARRTGAKGGTSAGGRARVLGFYAHVDAATRERAERAGFDLVVPRSRMAREGAELVSRLAGTAGGVR